MAGAHLKLDTSKGPQSRAEAISVQEGRIGSPGGAAPSVPRSSLPAKTPGPGEKASMRREGSMRAENPVPDWLKDKVDAVVWDFDKTILRIHAYGSRIYVDQVESRSLASDFADLEFFTTLVHRLEEAGIGVYVASYGRNDVIRAYLERAVRGSFGPDQVSTPATVGGRDGYPTKDGKNPQLLKICEVTGYKMDRLLFFDDDNSNVKQAEASGVMSVHCPEAFLRTTWERAMALVREYREVASAAAGGAGDGAAAPEPAAALPQEGDSEVEEEEEEEEEDPGAVGEEGR